MNSEITLESHTQEAVTSIGVEPLPFHGTAVIRERLLSHSFYLSLVSRVLHGPVSRWGHSAMQGLSSPGHIGARGFDKIYPTPLLLPLLETESETANLQGPLALSGTL